MTAAGRAADPGCWSPTSRGCWPAPTPRCCWPTWAPRWSRSRAPAGDETRSWSRPERDGVSTYYLGDQPREALDRARPARGGRPRARPRAGRPRRRGDRELQARRHGPVRPRLRVGAARPTPASSTPRSAGSAPGKGAHVPGYDLMVQAMSGLMSLTGDPDGPAVPGRHLGVRRDGRQPRGDRHPRRAAPPRGHRPGPARRGEPALLGADRPGQPQLRLCRRRGRPAPHGQRAPERLPLRAAARRRTAS